jgi:hypothetical protein
MKTAVVVASGLLCFVFLSVALPSYAGNTIKVGFVDTYSGPPSVYTFDVIDGFKIWTFALFRLRLF